jgi:hypothetical protein
MRAFQLLGEAEAAIHSIPIEKVHFHEVGAVDTIVDIVCSAAGAESLGIDRWLSSPLNVGSGTVVCQHGTLPVPAPATLALLGDAPVYAAGPPMERLLRPARWCCGCSMCITRRFRRCASRLQATARADAKRPASPTCCGCWWAKRPKKPSSKTPLPWNPLR